MESGRLLLVANASPNHLGGYLRDAAFAQGLETVVQDIRLATEGPRWAVAAAWRLGRRPLHLRGYGKNLLERCVQFRPALVLTTGFAPVSRNVLVGLRQMGIPVFNYLTDDPWNPNRRAPWFLRALSEYDHVFSPRRANLDDLARIGCRAVSYLPFAYDEEMHLGGRRDAEAARPDIVFVGGADADRVPFLAALIKAKFQVRLYGGYWQRYAETRQSACGFVDPREAKHVTATAKVAVCLVRRANRDGHCMRSFEIPAMGGCLLAESTAEHREIFGEEGRAALYFRDVPELVEKARWLLSHPLEREEMVATAHRLVTGGGHTYGDRLRSMLAYSPLVPKKRREMAERQ